ncbi:N-acetylmuramoyl-L-alanine amidase [Flocculibacter collagenilyticus]|uniref:N-acetylmuramoyl-L-alanine amidase n=1 Tax=Flocculibacter collagenilyticus TaxID=2744479 RepID=UPI0018F449AD|nr:N-acetylmuramoyl-L-alanine amidase [Flocculibacter collagenilyticus]
MIINTKNLTNVFVYTLCIFALLCSCFSFAINKINGVRVWPSPDNTRIVFDLSESAEYSYFTLRNPQRLVIDFKKTANDFNLSTLKIDDDNPLVKRVRQSKPKYKDSVRIVLDLTKPLNTVIFPLAPTAPYSDRLVVDLIDANARSVVHKQAVAKNRDIVIAIDAGHGGEDPGSIGPTGKYEKHITLGIAKRLATLINQEKGMKAILTRSADYYVDIGRRSEIARQKKADFLISIHADAFVTPYPRGASVWGLSLQRANSEIGKWLEKKEKHSELLGGAGKVITDTQNEKYLARTLLDMSMDHSISTGFEVAQSVIGEFRKVVKLHKKKPESANFGVLKSPDIPSILVETGFISNPKEEKLLLTASYQNKLAQALFVALRKHYRNNPPEGTYYAAHRVQQHKVSSGESLSLLAQRYNTTVSDLKKYNNLNTNTVRIGQVLRIPQS